MISYHYGILKKERTLTYLISVETQSTFMERGTLFEIFSTLFFECEISLKSMISYREAKSPLKSFEIIDFTKISHSNDFKEDFTTYYATPLGFQLKSNI